MGIKDFMKLVANNIDRVSDQKSIRGKLVVDGYSVLRDLYDEHHLDWANGGRYADQHRVTVEYYDCLVRAGVEPIVILDGGGCRDHLNDVIYRRNRTIGEQPKQLESYHSHKDLASHFMPILARQVYLTSLKERNIEVYVADGKSMKTIVRVANYFRCPILTNNTIYCACNVTGGVIFYKHLKIDAGDVKIYKQTKFNEFCNLTNPDLMLAVVAIMGDGSDVSVPFLYHGRIRAEIEREVTKENASSIRDRSRVLNVVDYLKFKGIKSFEEFIRELRSHNFGRPNFGRMCINLQENCQKVKNIYSEYFYDRSALSIDELNKSTSIKCYRSCDLPSWILQSYRNGTFPVLAMNAMSLGECVLEQNVGDYLEQPPPSQLGQPVRLLMYGLMSDLMKEGKIKEYCTYVQSGKLIYGDCVVAPSICSQQELLITNNMQLDHKILAKQAICDVLKCPMSILEKLKTESDQSLTIVTLVTCCWAKYLTEKRSLPYPEQLIRAVTLNFFLDLSGPNEHRSPEIDVSRFTDPLWIKVYHAVLEWQSLYRNVCSLNDVLSQPLSKASPCFLFDGPLVIFLALHESPDIFEFYERKLDGSKRAQYKLLTSIIKTLF